MTNKDNFTKDDFDKQAGLADNDEQYKMRESVREKLIEDIEKIIKNNKYFFDRGIKEIEEGIGIDLSGEEIKYIKTNKSEYYLIRKELESKYYGGEYHEGERLILDISENSEYKHKSKMSIDINKFGRNINPWGTISNPKEDYPLILKIKIKE